jgi:hypothetical protein
MKLFDIDMIIGDIDTEFYIDWHLCDIQMTIQNAAEVCSLSIGFVNFH